MIEEKIQIANIKCGGCEKSIENKLAEIEGVSMAKADFETGTVHFKHSGTTARMKVLQALKKMGYPEISEENPWTDKVKSYASCMIGKMS
ncbi:heavy-metal-associated domain-containing protein [bacterium]|nr:heavy-metal-associated domain-containing protein [bacterium]